MPQPYNYSQGFSNPADALVRGAQTGAALADVRAQAQARDLQLSQAQAQAQRRQQFQGALANLGTNPSAKQLTGLLIQYPEMSDMLKEGYTRLSAEEQKERTSQASSVYSAVLAGDNDLATSRLTEYAEAYRNAGREDDAKALEAQAELIKLHPESAERGVSLWLANAMGPEKFAETFGKLQSERRERDLEKSNLTIKEKQAEQEVVKSKFAESLAQSQLDLNDAQIRNLALDPEIKRANLKILALQAQYAKESNELKRQELQGKIEDANLARAEKARIRVADARRGARDIDSFINSIDEVLKQPTGFFSGAYSATGPLASKLPTFDPQTGDFEEMIEALGSQAFLTKIDALRGTGPISNIEGEKAQKALSNLSIRQSLPLLLKNLNNAREALLKMRGDISTRYGVDVGVPDTPNAAEPPDSPVVNDAVRKALEQGQ